MGGDWPVRGTATGIGRAVADPVGCAAPQGLTIDSGVTRIVDGQRVLYTAGFVAAYLCGFYLAPIPVLAVTCLGAAFLPTELARWAFVISACLLFTFLNLSKEIEGDLVYYSNIQHYLYDRPFSTLFAEAELRRVSNTYRITEFGFYAPLWLLANLFEDSEAIIPIAASVTIYTSLSAAIMIIARRQGWNHRLTLIVTLFTCFAGLNFVQTTHLLRQYLSGSLAFLAFAFWFAEKRWPAVLLAMAACSTHNGTVPIVVDTGLLFYLLPRDRIASFGVWSRVWRVLVVLTVGGALMALLILRNLKTVDSSEGAITVWHYAVVLVFFFLYLAFGRRSGDATRMHYGLVVVVGVILAISMVFFVIGLNVMALRYFAYLEWLYGLAVAGLLCAVPRRYLGAYLVSRWAICAVAMLLLLVRLDGSSWEYGEGHATMFTTGLPGVAWYWQR